MNRVVMTGRVDNIFTDSFSINANDNLFLVKCEEELINKLLLDMIVGIDGYLVIDEAGDVNIGINKLTILDGRGKKNDRE